jgi:DNA polymerase III epsilon subunit-like protein
VKPNAYDGWCATCAVAVPAGSGRLTGAFGNRQVVCLVHVPVAPERGDHDGWFRLPLASLDFETTGVDPHADRVVSYALLGPHGEDVVGLVDPGVEVPAAASAVHGLTAEHLRGAPTSYEAVSAIAEWVQTLADAGVGLVVYNAAYDLTMLRAECERWGVLQPDWSRLLVVDPLVVDWSLHRGTLGSRTLGIACDYYGVRIADAHDARCDAVAAREVAVEIGARHREVGEVTLEALVHHQRGWFGERADDWNAYARRAGRRVEDRAGWPLALPLPQLV